MTQPPKKAVPTKCTTCEALQQVPLACEDCNRILAHVQGADYFELFGLPRVYDLDVGELNKKYLTICRNIHPDKFAAAGDQMQSFALRASASVNTAYDVLQDPVHRAEYLLESAGGSSSAEDKRVPPDLLGQVMMMREQIEEAKAENDQDALGAIKTQVLQQRQATEARIANLCRDLDEASEEVKATLRLELNAMKYINNLLAQL